MITIYIILVLIIIAIVFIFLNLKHLINLRIEEKPDETISIIYKNKQIYNAKPK